MVSADEESNEVAPVGFPEDGAPQLADAVAIYLTHALRMLMANYSPGTVLSRCWSMSLTIYAMAESPMPFCSE